MAYKETILQAEPKDIKPFGISQQTLYNLKQAIVNNGLNNVKPKTIKPLLAYIHASQLLLFFATSINVKSQK